MFLKAYGCAFLFSIYLSSVYAQTQFPTDRDLSNERQERLLKEQHRRLDELQSLPGRELSTPSLSTDDSSDCLPINTINLTGAHTLSVRQRAQLLEPFGDCN